MNQLYFCSICTSSFDPTIRHSCCILSVFANNVCYHAPSISTSLPIDLLRHLLVIRVVLVRDTELRLPLFLVAVNGLATESVERRWEGGWEDEDFYGTKIGLRLQYLIRSVV